MHSFLSSIPFLLSQTIIIILNLNSHFNKETVRMLSLSLSVHFFLSLLVQNHNAPASPLPGGASVTTTVRVQVDILEDTVMFLHSQ